ncbi:Lipoprotein-anchoring transpeptidase ErfK/SrfK [Amycolatopsis xylanica]|uniref:Lipoprotein-anchoring transpeptidase ErfK/SrfK n=1 Tax=Amycolatopsis xylanica TaxID=589385 RepID=A0A1H2ZGE1_9PSEU|nr:L,D-transpeptidase [Amycolatopsis xylanica]SDX16490.1 Lipoprotein-anchoring transpeptidase ErfK/SrfK [Amycolatopsis xylanica]
MKKILAGVAAALAAVVLTACSGGAPSNVDTVPVAANAATTTQAPTSTSSSSAEPTPSPTPSSSSSAKPTPTSKKPAPKPEPKPQAAAGVPCAATVDVCFDVSAKKVWLLKDGQVVYGPVGALGGRKGNPTPVGTFHVISKVKNYHSKQFDAPMPNSVFFAAGIAFHTGSLSVYSHGCVHLSPAASAKLFSSLSVGDVVQVVP